MPVCSARHRLWWARANSPRLSTAPAGGEAGPEELRCRAAWLCAPKGRQAKRPIDAYRRALALQANNARGHSGLCSTLLANDRRGDAVDECRKAVESAPDSVRYKAQLAATVHDRQPYSGHDQLQCGLPLSRRPSDVSTLGTLGDLYMLAGQFAQAAGVYETIARDHPDISVVYLRLTAAYDYLDRPVDSIAAAKKFVAMEPQLLLGQLILGDALRTGDSSTSRSNRSKKPRTTLALPPRHMFRFAVCI